MGGFTKDVITTLDRYIPKFKKRKEGKKRERKGGGRGREGREKKKRKEEKHFMMSGLKLINILSNAFINIKCTIYNQNR